APENTTWENWEDLCMDYNLEDKVNFEEGSIDTDKGGAGSNGPEDNIESNIAGKPKRNIVTP
ncbi:hypothetical protein A2U01_0089956, partial [Trifolium medium]|nr:hypothetical protein [Trifolium medium]